MAVHIKEQEAGSLIQEACRGGRAGRRASDATKEGSGVRVGGGGGSEGIGGGVGGFWSPTRWK